MRIIVVGSHRHASEEQDDLYFSQLAAFLQAPVDGSIVVEYVLFSQLRFEVNRNECSIYDTKNAHELKDYDLAIIRGDFRYRVDIVFAISTYMQHHRKRTVNDYAYSYNSSKLAQAFVFAGLGMPTPHTISGSSAILKEYAPLLGLPFICKEVYGSHGRNNFLVRDVQELDEIVAKEPERLFVAQEFIPNDGDYRLLIIGQKYLIIKRTASGESHLNNTSQGGRAALMPPDALPAIIITQAKQYMKTRGMTIAGVDVIYDKRDDRYLFLEVNSQPQIFSGAFITEKQQLIGEYLRSLDL